MPQTIDRNQVQKLLKEQRAQLVEVLPAKQYNDVHLAGALNIPLQELNEGSTASLQKDRPVIVYCYDCQ
jgi:rhodanese-related sulfurtransferase